MRLKAIVTGIVQGVGFRPFVYRTAVAHDLVGYVRNRGDAGVEILLEGEEDNINSFLTELKEKKPHLAQIYEITTSKLEGDTNSRSFIVEKSSLNAELSGSVIPPDLAICHDCLNELRNPEDPRFNYFFITCTNCGPRFTIIERLPYDRQNTTMRKFPMCSFCKKEYNHPMNRRFHAETIACPTCGPKVYLTTAQGETIAYDEPIREAGQLLSEGNILAIKGYGGFHIAASATKDSTLARIREVKHRRHKPFAVMARGLDAAKTFAQVTEKDAELLNSYSRPIVLLDKKPDSCLSELIAPGLHNIGVMLPYTGLHYMLFDQVKDTAFVMTSANAPNEPIIKDNDEALKNLTKTVDYFLFHNREIAHRCDDSVLRTHGRQTVFMRRSRGYAPVPIILKKRATRCVLALGGELNNTACVLNDNKVFISQHIGDVENVETRAFLETAAKHLIHLTNSKIETVACDLHPKFTTTKLAQELAGENDWQVQQVQHHHAHIAALLVEHDADGIVGVCCDGYGYGADGEAWGGEVLLCSKCGEGFKRVAHMEPQPLVGGDLATRYPMRMVAGILHGRVDIQNWLLEKKNVFPLGEKEIEIVLKQLESKKTLMHTTSCGRILDAVSAILNVCFERTYEGEPAMKLESIAGGGKNVLGLKPVLHRNTLQTTPLLEEIYGKIGKFSTKNLAYSAHMYLAEGLAELALEEANRNKISTIGFSGGVAANKIMAERMKKIIEDACCRFLVHKAIPPGDGGISFGQAVVSGGFL